LRTPCVAKRNRNFEWSRVCSEAAILNRSRVTAGIKTPRTINDGSRYWGPRKTIRFCGKGGVTKHCESPLYRKAEQRA
jgi:hypothetical protein